MNRRLILRLSLLGPAMGTLIVLGTIPEGGDRFAWMAVDIACAIVIARSDVENVFWHGAITGFIVGASGTLVQGLFADAYFANNPWVVEVLEKKLQGSDLQFFVMMLVPFHGVASALLTGFLSFLAGKVFRRETETS